MTAGEILRVAAEGLTGNKMRSLLTMLGVIIGVAAVIVMMAVSAGTEAEIAAQINSLGANLIFVSRSSQRSSFNPGAGGTQAGGLVYSDAAAIAESVPGISGVSVEQQSIQTVKYGNVAVESVTILGTTPDFPQVRGVEIASGRFFTENENDRGTRVAVLGYDLALELFGEPGDPGYFEPIGQKVMVDTTRLTVIGVAAERGSVGGANWDGYLYTPIQVVFDRFTNSLMSRVVGDAVRQIYVQAESPEAIEPAIQQISLLLARLHDVSLSAPDFTITTQQDIITTQSSTTEAFRSLLAWVAGVSLIVGGIGIMNIMMVSVTERTREIGIRQAVGATPGDIRGQFLTEALLLSLLGGLIGVLAGVGGSYAYGAMSDMPTVVVPASIGLAFGSAAIVGIFFGVYPANKAAQLDPIESLRHE
ncbi:MAG: ABC transporter permease [Anaerolineae bacterium]